MKHDPNIVVFRISGAFFFGAASRVGSALDRTSDGYRMLVIDFAGMPLLDSTGANVLTSALTRAVKKGVRVAFAGVRPEVRKMLEAHGAEGASVTCHPDVATAVESFRKVSGEHSADEIRN